MHICTKKTNNYSKVMLLILGAILGPYHVWSFDIQLDIWTKIHSSTVFTTIFCYIIFLTFSKRSNIETFFLFILYAYQVGYVNLSFYRGCCFYVIRVHHKEPAVVDQDTTKYNIKRMQHVVFW